MWQKIDDGIAKLERLMLLVSLGMMTILIGLDVTQRTFSRPLGRTEALVAAIIELFSGPLSEDARATAYRVGGVLFVVVALVLFAFAANAAGRVTAERAGQAPPPFASSAAKGVGVFVALAIAVKLLLVVFPSSVPGAQKFALGFMLWAGMLGASLATRQRRHIMLDPIVKKLTGDDRKRFAGLSGVVTAVFCFVIFVLGATQVGGEIHEWREGEGTGNYPALPIPMWLGSLSVPVAFAIMTVRFFMNGILDWKNGPPNTTDAHSVDLEEVEKLAGTVSSAEAGAKS